MRRVLILVEGQTEERFVKDVLEPHFLGREICLHPTIVDTKKVKDGPNFKGGLSSYAKAKQDLFSLFRDTDAAAITTMFDFYGLPTDFPSWTEGGDCYEQVRRAEEAFATDISRPRFLPYLQLHEFEGLLFSVPQEISNALDRSKETEVQNIRNSFTTPEEINRGAATAPSKRLLRLFPNYNKPVYGSLIASRTGFNEIRDKCPHFREWIEKIEAL